MSTTANPAASGAEVSRPPRRRLDFLDGVRGLAATYVVVSHAWDTVIGHGTKFSPLALSTVWLGGGRYAVTVFIVVSGFSLGLTFWRGGGHWPGGPRDFLLRRFRRLVPPYWIAIAVCALVAMTVLSQPQGTLWDGAIPNRATGIVSHSLALQDVWWAGPAGSTAFWSLAVELHIYLGFALALVLLRRWLPPVMVVYTALAGLTVVLQMTHSPLAGLYPSLYAMFLLGLLASRFAVLGEDAIAEALPRWRRRIAYCVGLGVVASVLCLPTFSFASPVTDLVVGPVAAALLVMLLRGKLPWLQAITRARVSVWLGHSSYSMYLIHPMILELVWRGMVRPWGLPQGVNLAGELVVGVACSILAGRLFYRLFERPFMSRRSRPADALTRASAPAG